MCVWVESAASGAKGAVVDDVVDMAFAASLQVHVPRGHAGYVEDPTRDRAEPPQRDKGASVQGVRSRSAHGCYTCVVSTRLLILGGGFTGAAVARRALADGARVATTTRDASRAAALEQAGVQAIVLPTWTADALAAHVDEATRVVVTFPPDGVTDRAVAKGVARAAAVAYVSSTGVYGDVRGRVDDDTPAHATSARAIARLDAEAAWRDVGAVIVRAPGIYGPERGVHVRLARGTFRIPGDGRNFVSRIHVDDLAATLWALVVRGARDATFVTGDAEPTTHWTVVQWLCDAMHLPLPPHVPLDQVDETLRNDRRVDGGRLRAWVGVPLVYPTYKEGFAQCLAAERRDGAPGSSPS